MINNNKINILIDKIDINERFSNKKLSILLLWEIYWENKKSFITKIKRNYSKSYDDLKNLLNKTEWLFTIIIKDLEKNKTLIINDKLWLKPFYIYKDKDKIILWDNFLNITSDLNKKVINYKAIFEILSLWFLTWWKTIIKNLTNIQAWTITIIEQWKISKNRYYKIKKIVNVNEDKIYSSFINWLKKRTKKLEDINCDLTWWYDTRFILWNLKKIYWNKNIFTFTKDIDKHDVEISKIISKYLKVKHSLLKVENNKKDFINEMNFKLNPKKSDRNIISWLCWWEILWNAIGKSWFMSDNIEEFINKKYVYNKEEYNIIKWRKKIKYWIKSFTENILRTNLNAIEWFAWINPSSYFLWDIISPFTDSDFISSAYSQSINKLKNYHTYKSIYRRFLPDLLEKKYTFNNERENIKFDEKNNFISKNYIINNKEYKLCIKILDKIIKNEFFLNNIIDKNIIYKKPIEVLIIILQLNVIKFNNDK